MDVSGNEESMETKPDAAAIPEPAAEPVPAAEAPKDHQPTEPAADQPAPGQTPEQPNAGVKQEPAGANKPPAPTIVVQFLSTDSANFTMQLVGFNERAVTFQLSALAQYLQARAQFGWNLEFEQGMARFIAQQQAAQEAMKAPAARRGIVVPPPGMRVPPRPQR